MKFQIAESMCDIDHYLPLAQAALPPVGDTLIPQLPRVALILGLATFLAGFLLLMRSRKKLTI